MSQENIFREIDEELRSDRMRALWSRYSPYIIGAAVAVVLLVGVSEGWKWYSQSTAARAADQLYSAFEQAGDGDYAAAAQTLNQLQANGVGQYPLLSQFEAAGLLVEQGKLDEAVAAYDALAASASDQRMRELALVLAAYILVDKGDAGAVETRVLGMRDANSPLRNSAREALGLAYYNAGDGAAAKAVFDEIVADPESGSEQRSRVRLYLSQLVAEGVVDANEGAQPSESDTAAPQ